MKNLLGLIKQKLRISDKLLHTHGIEFFAVDHCSLRCLGCSQNSPYLDAHFADSETFKNSLDVLKKYLRPEKITILGGEPLLHPEIDKIINIARRSGMFGAIHITTNGTNLLKMTDFFWQTIDKLNISKYSVNLVYINSILKEVEVKCKQYNVEIEIRDMEYFNHIVLTEENRDKEIVGNIYRKCIYKYFCHTISNDRLYRCSPVVNFGKMKRLGIFENYIDNDYLKIEDSGHFRTDLFEYLNSSFPLRGCNFCLGTSGKPFQQRQLTKDELDGVNPSSVTTENCYDKNID